MRAFMALTVALMISLPAIAQEMDLQRGLRNYQAIIAGKSDLSKLSPQEQQEVLAVSRLIRRRSDDGSEECQDARSAAESAASELEYSSRRLRNCASAGDYQDDCSSEFRRVRNAQSTYESAVSGVQSSCD